MKHNMTKHSQEDTTTFSLVHPGLTLNNYLVCILIYTCLNLLKRIYSYRVMWLSICSFVQYFVRSYTEILLREQTQVTPTDFLIWSVIFIFVNITSVISPWYRTEKKTCSCSVLLLQLRGKLCLFPWRRKNICFIFQTWFSYDF